MPPATLGRRRGGRRLVLGPLGRVLTILLGLVSSGVAAAPDALRAALAASADAWGSRWELLDQGPEWLAGERPRSERGQAWLHLEPGEAAELLVPAAARLRLLPEGDTPLLDADLTFALDNGTGLALQVTAEPFDAGLALRSPLQQVGRLRIERPDTAAAGLSVALYLEQRDPLPDLVRYPQAIALPGESLELVDATAPGALEVWPLAAETWLAFEVTGPLRLALESRLRYPVDRDSAAGWYRIQWRLDAAPEPELVHLTVPDYRHDLSLAGLPALLGTPEHAYLEVPEGRHRLQLRADADLLLRVQARSAPDFLLPRLNRPAALAAAERRGMPTCGAPWSVAEGDLVAPLWCQALALAFDNGHAPAGLEAVALLDALAEARPQLPELQIARSRVANAFSFYRGLLPATPVEAQTRAAFPTPRLLDLGERRWLRLWDSQARGLARRVPHGDFVRLDVRPLIYRIPELSVPSRLRLAVVGQGRWWLRLDGGAPRALWSREALPAESFQLDPVGSALANATTTLSAPLSGEAGPTPLVVAAYLDVPLPAASRTLELWQATDAAAPLWVAVAYRAADAYRADERTFASLLGRLGGERALALLWQLLATEGPSGARAAAASPDEAAWLNLWLPWRRALVADARGFAAGLGAGPPLPEATPLTPADAARLRQQAVASDGVAAVEAWSRLAAGSRGATRAAALLRLADALSAAGEDYLAERLLRWQVADGDAAAAERLAQVYRARADWQALEGLAASRLLRQPALATLTDLVRAMSQSEPRLAGLMLGLLVEAAGPLAADLRPALLEAAVALEWPASGARLAAPLPPAERLRWEGHAAARRGDWAQALNRYRAAGAPEGAALADVLRLREALALDADWSRVPLPSRLPGSGPVDAVAPAVVPEAASDSGSVPASASASALTPGQTTERRLVQVGRLLAPASAGGTLVLSQVVDRTLRWRAAEARRGASAPAASQGSTAASQQRLRRLGEVLAPAVARGPAILTQGLETAIWAGAEVARAALPGRAAALAAWADAQTAGGGRLGWQPAPWLARASAGGLLLLDPEQQRYAARLLATPERPLALRVVGPARLRVGVRLLHGPDAELLEDWLLVGSRGQVMPLALEPSRPVAGLQIAGATGLRLGLQQERILALPPGEQTLTLSARVAPLVADLALEQPSVPWFGPLTPEAGEWLMAAPPPSASPADPGRASANRWWGETPAGALVRVASPSGGTRQAALSRQLRLAERLPSTQAPASADSPGPPVPVLDESVVRLNGWLWELEHQGRLTPEALAGAGRLLAAQASAPQARALAQRLLRATHWVPLELLEGGEGIRYRESQLWEPESPTVRTRAALLPPARPGERLLVGDTPLILDLESPQPRRLRLDLELETPGFLPLEASTLVLRLSGQPSAFWELHAAAPRLTRMLDLPAGRQQLDLEVPRPTVNQLLRVRLLDAAAGAESPLLQPTAKAYQVATAARPLVAHLEGPAWVRIDEWRDAERLSSYQAVAAGWQRVRVAPEAGRSERLVRLFQLVPSPEVPRRPELRPLPPAGPALAGPAAELRDLLATVPAVASVAADAGWPPRRCVTGTWNLGLSGVETSGSVDEGEGGGLDRYLQTSLTYRHRHPTERRWVQLQLLNRWRPEGKPTLGLTALLYRQPETLPFNWEVEGRLYSQWLAGRPEWSVQVDAAVGRTWALGPATRYAQRATLFARALSLDAAPDAVEALDADVYSDYKRDHPYGLRLSNQLTQRPWQDAEWRLRGAVATNQNLVTADWVTLSAGWRQRLRDLELDTRLRWTQRFADADRESADDEILLGLGLNWELLRNAQGELVLGLLWEQALDDQADRRLMIGLDWQGPAARGDRDFRPGEQPFSALRAWRRHETASEP